MYFLFFSFSNFINSTYDCGYLSNNNLTLLHLLEPIYFTKCFEIFLLIILHVINLNMLISILTLLLFILLSIYKYLFNIS